MTRLINYFTNLNSAGQALFVVGVLLVLTFIILLIVVLKPEKKPNKIYGENEETDKEEIFEKRLKDIDNINENDINIENDRTRNLKNIVDELKGIEKVEYTREELIERYEKDEEDTAVISLDALLNNNKPFKMERRPIEKEEVYATNDDDDFLMEDVTSELPIVKKKREIYSSVYVNDDDNDDDYFSSYRN